MAPDSARQIEDVHRSAMLWADRAKVTQDAAVARRRFEVAARLERQAGLALPTGFEPSRSVLLRSAAWLFLSSNRVELAIDAARAGLAGNPPKKLRDELREVLHTALGKLEVSRCRTGWGQWCADGTDRYRTSCVMPEGFAYLWTASGLPYPAAGRVAVKRMPAQAKPAAMPMSSQAVWRGHGYPGPQLVVTVVQAGPRRTAVRLRGRGLMVPTSRLLPVDLAATAELHRVDVRAD